MSTHRRAAARGGAITTPPWLRAPLLLVRQPVVFLAIVAAAIVLATAAASGPLFLSTIGTAGLHAQAQQSCPEDTRPGMTATLRGSELGETERAGLQAMRTRNLPAPYVVAYGQAQVQSSLIHLFARSDALAHVHTLTPVAGAGAGVWVPQTFAAKIGATPGSIVRTTEGAQLRVAGIYRDLAPDPFALADLEPYWCSWSSIIVSTVASDGAIAATPPQRRQGPVFLTDPATVARATAGDISVSWHSPMSTVTSPLGAFEAADRRMDVAAAATGAQRDTHLAAAIAAARAGRQGISGSILPIEIAGVLIAALLVGGAGVFWANARRREIRLLVARGVGPLPLAGKAVLETILPAAIGAGLGLLTTLALVRSVGPAQVLEGGATRSAATVVGATLLLGLVLIATIGGVAGRERTSGRRASRLVLVPWELALIGAAVVLGIARLHTSAVTVDHTVVRISSLVILYPLLGASGALLLLGRLVGAMLPSFGHRARRAPHTAYLAVRRMSRSRLIAIGVLIGTALPCCLLMYGSTVTDTVRREVTQKYETNLGAPHVLQVFGIHGALVDLQGHGTQVVVYDQDVLLGSDDGYVIGVDPATFERFAFVSGAQRSAVSKLHPVAHGARIPAIVVNAEGNHSNNLLISHTRLHLAPVTHTAVFPGLRNGAFPMIVVDSRALASVDNGTERTNQIWTDATNYAAARHLVGAKHFTILFELTAKIVVGSTGLLPVTWIFGYLQALAVLIGIVAVAGLVFGLASRTRARRVSYVLSRRMGMARRTHLMSLLLELGMIIGVGWVAGSSLGIGSFGLIYRRLDVYPELPPPATFHVPAAPVLLTGAVVAVVVAIAGIATHALAERTRPAEILRLE